MKGFFRLFCVTGCIMVMAASSFAEGIILSYEGSESSYVMYERTDVRRYDNNRYTGLLSREVRSMVSPIEPLKGSAASYQNDSWFKGSFMVMEDTKSSSAQTLRSVNSMVPATFHIAHDGTLTVVPGYNTDHTYRRDTGFPTYRSFPAYPSGEVNVGDTWTSTAYRAVDPLGTGLYTKLQIVVQYTYQGDEVYKGIPCRMISAKWATRYGNGTLYHDYDGDPDLTGATGTHSADIRVSIETGDAILIRDYLDETFTYKNGQTVRFVGTCLMFTEYMPAVDRSTVLEALGKIATVSGSISGSSADTTPEADATPDWSSAMSPSSTAFGGGPLTAAAVTGALSSAAANNTAGGVQSGATGEESGSSGTSGAGASSASSMVVEETEAGIRLSVRDIRFVADSAVILSEEQWRLDAVAEVLKLIPGGQFLIEGHAASTGNPQGEQQLSVERARSIAAELVKRGIPEAQLMYTGLGSTRPVADNSTFEGRAQNRRVEITILE